jgi:SAM-dependent methyltransferase
VVSPTLRPSTEATIGSSRCGPRTARQNAAAPSRYGAVLRPRVTALWCRYRARVHPGSDVRAVERALAAYYEQEASDRAKRPIDPQRVEARTRFITRLDGRRPRILEVGVGPGRDAASFVAEGIPVVGVDLAVEHALRASWTGVHAVVATVRRLPFGNSAFAALWTMSTLMHVPNAAIADALVELRRVLAPGALAAVGVWGGPDVEHHRGIDDFDQPRFFSLRSDERWRSLLSTLGSVEDFEIWGRRGDDFWYQWAVVRTA